MKRGEIIAELELIRDKCSRLIDNLRESHAPEQEPLRSASDFVVEDDDKTPLPVRDSGDGTFVDFDATALHVTDDGERKSFKARGGAWKKFGVTVWPEVLEGTFGVNPESLKPGLYEFKHKCRVLMEGDKPKKVVGRAV